MPLEAQKENNETVQRKQAKNKQAVQYSKNTEKYGYDEKPSEEYHLEWKIDVWNISQQ